MIVQNRVSYAVAVNCMRLIRDGGVNDAFESLGIIPEDFDLVCRSVPWIGNDRLRVTTVINSLCHGTVDVCGLPRIEIPAEFIASVLSMFVSPGNLMIACRWMEAEKAAEDLAAGGSLEAVQAKKLFALCCQLVHEAPAATAQWEKRTGRAVRRVLEAVPSTEQNDGL